VLHCVLIFQSRLDSGSLNVSEVESDRNFALQVGAIHCVENRMLPTMNFCILIVMSLSLVCH